MQMSYRRLLEVGKIREGERAAFALWFVLFLLVSAFCGYKPSLYSVNSFLRVCLDLSQSSTEERERHLKAGIWLQSHKNRQR